MLFADTRPMSTGSSLILGLGLFFLGVRMVTNYLQRLAGPTFRRVVARSTSSPWRGGATGLLFGMLMQSATAVTFILVTMQGLGLVGFSAALPVIVWSNVGLTVLAFVVTLDIHPLVAWAVGLSGIALSMIRRGPWHAAAGVAMGLGLILMGLQEMSGGAAPLKDAVWFHELLRLTWYSPMVAFAVGALAAALLQSNTGAALLVITLAGVGAFDLDHGMMLIFGANVGSIGLRIVLAWRLRGPSRRLVRFEDFFVLGGAGLMVALFYLEAAGLPLLRGVVQAVSEGIRGQLAWLFLLSNLLPAVLIMPLLGPVQALLEWLWPDDPPSGDKGDPLYLNRAALDDVTTALDGLEHETTHLWHLLARGFADGSLRWPRTPGAAPPETPVDLLLRRMEDFADRLAAREQREPAEIERLHRIRRQMNLARYLREASGELLECLDLLPPALEAGVVLREEANRLLDRIAAGQIGESLRRTTASGGELASRAKPLVRTALATAGPDDGRSLLAASEAFEIFVWIVHRLAKLPVMEGDGICPLPAGAARNDA